MDTEHRPAGCVFWPLWVTFTTGGWVLGEMLGQYVVTRVGGRTHWAEPLAPLYWVLGAAVTGATIGLAQGLVRSRHPLFLVGWVVAPACGWSLGELAAQGIIVGVAGRLGTWPAGVPLVWEWLGRWLVVGLSAGALQWLVLRRNVCYAGGWVLASTGGWLAGGLAKEWRSGEFSFGTEYVVGGLLAGGITGAFFVAAPWLRRSQSQRRQRLTNPLPPPSKENGW
jgi:hypothetical protein